MLEQKSCKVISDLGKAKTDALFQEGDLMEMSRNNKVYAVYKRLTRVQSSHIMSIYDLFTDTWSIKSSEYNYFNVDFKLYSSVLDAEQDKNPWKFCNGDDPGVGFPRDCGPTGNVPSKWIAKNSRRKCGASQTITLKIGQPSIPEFSKLTLNVEGAHQYTGSNDKKFADKPKYQMTGAFSVSAWVKPEKRLSDWARVVGKGGTINRNFGLWISSAGYPLAQIYGIGPNTGAQGGSKVPLGTWTELTMVYDKTYLKLYVNGKLAAMKQANTGAPRTDGQPVTIGKASFHKGFVGYIKEVKIWKDEALSSTEIQHNHRWATQAPTTAPTPQPTRPPTNAPTTGAPTESPHKVYVRATTGTHNKHSGSNNKPSIILTGDGLQLEYTLKGLPSMGSTKKWSFTTSKDIGVINKVTLTSAGVDAWQVTSLEVKTTSQGKTITPWTNFECPGGFWLDGKPYDKAATYAPIPYGDKLVLDRKCTCACTVALYDDNDFRGRKLESKTVYKHDKWVPKYRLHPHSVQMSRGCKNNQVILADDDSYQVDNTPISYPGVHNLPHDLEEDLAFIEMTPHENCDPDNAESRGHF
jgi:hypothetical protein